MTNEKDVSQILIGNGLKEVEINQKDDKRGNELASHIPSKRKEVSVQTSDTYNFLSMYI